jgi:hypothetical protein
VLALCRPAVFPIPELQICEGGLLPSRRPMRSGVIIKFPTNTLFLQKSPLD